MLRNCEGKEVRGSEGHKVGKVVRCEGDELLVESGLFRVDSFLISFDEVASVTDGELFLRRPAHFYNPRAPRTDAWSPWHSGRRDAEARDDMDGLQRADHDHRLGAQGVEALAGQARSSCPPQEGEAPADGEVPAVPHPEDEPWS